MTDPEREVAAIQFGRNLRRYRRRAGLTQARLSYLAVLHRTEISLLERGRREPRLGTIVKIASALEVSLNMLLKGPGWNIPRSMTRDPRARTNGSPRDRGATPGTPDDLGADPEDRPRSRRRGGMGKGQDRDARTAALGAGPVPRWRRDRRTHTCGPASVCAAYGVVRRTTSERLNNSLRSTSSARATRSSDENVGFDVPRSIPPTEGKSLSKRSASSSWVSPASRRSSSTACPRAAWSGDLGLA